MYESNEFVGSSSRHRVAERVTEHTNALIEKGVQFKTVGYDDLPLGALKPDLTYQRGPTDSRVKKIAANYLPPSAGTIIVSRRRNPTGGYDYYVVDGWHRVTAKKKALKKRPELGDTMPSMIYEFATIEDESTTFAILNSNRKPMSSAIRVRALATSGDERAKYIFRLIERANREPTEKSSALQPHKIGCVGTMYRLLCDYTAAFKAVWDFYEPFCGPDRMVHGHVLHGLVYLESAARREGKTVLDEKNAKRWEKVGYTAMIECIKGAIARHGKGGEKVYAWALQQQYNRHCSSGKLDDLVKL